jgi:uncharacterized protein YmfQ (DUF2313 family)
MGPLALWILYSKAAFFFWEKSKTVVLHNKKSARKRRKQLMVAAVNAQGKVRARFKIRTAQKLGFKVRINQVMGEKT